MRNFWWWLILMMILSAGLFSGVLARAEAPLTHPVEMVTVTTTTFVMGASGDEGGDLDEYPRHEVTLDAYRIGKVEITNGQYAEVMNWAQDQGRLQNAAYETYTGGDLYFNGEMLLALTDPSCQLVFDNGRFGCKTREGRPMENHPVVMVTWYGAVAFCNWLSIMEGAAPLYFLSDWSLMERQGPGYRLPTEAEWECAAAWDGSKHWVYGYQSDQATSRRMCFAGSNPLGLTSAPLTASVGYYNGINPATEDSPSFFGAYDMSGNVWEWTQDWYKVDYYSESPAENPLGPVSGEEKTLRGGDWMHQADRAYCRTASRSRAPRFGRANDSGFRVVQPSLPAQVDYEPGDVDGDGDIDSVDAGLINDHLIEKAPLTGGALARADANEDGAVNLQDVVWVTNQFTEMGDDEITLTLPGDVPLELVKIPAGSFEMGTPLDEQDRDDDEGPVHTVNIAYDFYLGKYELTKAQWEAVMGTTLWNGQANVLNYLNSPATHVSWDDAQAFMDALNTHLTDTGQGPATMRLPSEAEWEYACRAGTTTRFYWGDDLDESQIGDYAWWEGNAENAGEGYAHGVGQKLPNAWGLYDMSGNVFEWCQDDYHGDYTGAPTDGSAWRDGSGSLRVRRGGGWYDSPDDCRSGDRYLGFPHNRSSSVGFRLALPTGP